MPQLSRFHDRSAAGRELALEVGRRFGIPSALAAVSPGGGEVALAVARAFARPLAFAYCAPLRLPWAEGPLVEFGALDPDGRAVFDYGALASYRLSVGEIETARRIGEREIRDFGTDGIWPTLDQIAPAPTLLLIDDGLAPGRRMEAAVAFARRRRFARLLVASPCASPGAAAWFRADADGFIALAIDDDPTATHYRSFLEVNTNLLRVQASRAQPLYPRDPAAVR